MRKVKWITAALHWKAGTGNSSAETIRDFSNISHVFLLRVLAFLQNNLADESLDYSL
jgi:hypothetical protein